MRPAAVAPDPREPEKSGLAGSALPVDGTRSGFFPFRRKGTEEPPNQEPVPVNIRKVSLISFLAPTIMAGCGSGSGQGSTSVDHWLGDATHLAITGTFQDKTFNVHMEGAAAEGIYCNRFYSPVPGTQPDANGNYDTGRLYFVMKELGGVIDLDGTPTEFTISYWRHDIAAGASLEVIPRVFGTSIPDGQTWSDINLFAPGAGTLTGIESAASSGNVSMKLNTGMPDANGIMVPSGGRTGEFVSVTWGPHEVLNVSSTADCTTVPIMTWPQSRLLP